MNGHILSISAATRSAIRDHIEKSEKPTEWPYLDIKGNVTIGVGFKSDTEDDFAKLDLQLFKDGKWVTANGDEKRQAFQQMQDEKKKRGGNLNADADDYKDITNVRMAKPDQDALLDRKISENIKNIKNGVGEDAWNRLNDSQKAAVTDIRYANGSLDRFDNLKDAIKEGNAKKMADESTFFTNSKTGQRDEGRLKRNFQALSGLSQEEAEKRLQDVLKKNDAARKNSPIRNATPPVKPEPPEKPGDRSDPPSGDVQKQSARLPDPGDDTGNETKDFTPEQNNLLKDFDKNDGPLDDILAKDPGDLTETEFLEVKKAMIDLPAGPEQDRLDEVATKFLDEKFGTDPVKVDAIGRMIDPEPIRPINKTPVPAKTPDGEPLTAALKRIGKAVAGNAGSEGAAPAVQGLQRGLNILRKVLSQSAGKPEAGAPVARTPGIVARPAKFRRPPFSTILVPELKTDGVVGPKTRRALRIATSRLGFPKIEEGLALGRFGQFAQDVQTGRDDTRKLDRTINKSFGPLFRDPRSPWQRPNHPTEENLSFQATVNDLGSNVFGRDRFKPIKEDGLIGPRTESAFNTVLPAAGPDRFTFRLGHNLGFFDFGGFS
ncbi:MAG: hypothetical protein IIC06_00645 [Proteobacteria bacterium]|nr:hypothetical protein [Pseudomonadota bacterium]